MKPYLEPLVPGQAFSFVEPVYAKLWQGIDRQVFTVLKDKSEYEAHEGRKTVVSPSQQLIVQEYVYLACFHWLVPVWLPDEKCEMSFGQRIDVSILRKRRKTWWFPENMEAHQEGALAVTNVGWPEPTPESLMVQVRCLSYWSGSPFDHQKSFRPVQWRECMKLLKMPLEEGVPLALEWLERGKYVSDPAAALRERGFDV